MWILLPVHAPFAGDVIAAVGAVVSGAYFSTNTSSPPDGVVLRAPGVVAKSVRAKPVRYALPAASTAMALPLPSPRKVLKSSAPSADTFTATISVAALFVRVAFFVGKSAEDVQPVNHALPSPSPARPVMTSLPEPLSDSDHVATCPVGSSRLTKPALGSAPLR